MKLPLKMILIALLSTSKIFIGCQKDDDCIDKDSANDVSESTSDFVPKNIVGKILTLYNSNMKVVQKANGFTSGGSCTVHMLTSDFKLTTTPLYTFTKGDDNTATFQLKYTYKLQISSYYTNTKSTLDVDFTFSSESGGTYTGTDTSESTGNVSASNGTSQRTITGTFVIL